MLLSIIIPVYNVEAYLTECLDSVFTQNLNYCEVITINDGSTDSSGKVLADYQKTHPELIIIDQQNKGLSGARNTGMTHAKGDYLYFLDSDDYMLPNAIAKILETIANTNAEVIGFNATANATAVYIPSYNVSDVPKSGVDYFVDYYKDNGVYPNINVPIYVYQKSFLESYQLSFKEGIYHEDILFTILVFYYTKSICAINFPIFNYRQHREGSITTNVKLKNLTDRTKICRELDNFFEDKYFNNIHFYNVLYHQYLFNISQAVSNGFTIRKRLFFNKKDKLIMKKGITNEFEYKLWVLAGFNINLQQKYMKNYLSDFQRKIINIIGTILYK